MKDNLAILIFLTALGSWVTHVYTCLTNGDWGFLVAGALFFPIGMFHGAGIWLGIW
jgi:hypothetical protein